MPGTWDLKQSIIVGGISFAVGLFLGWIIFYHIPTSPGVPLISKYQVSQGPPIVARIQFTVPANCQAIVTSQLIGHAVNKAVDVKQNGIGTALPISASTPALPPGSTAHTCASGSDNSTAAWQVFPGSYSINPYALFGTECNGTPPTSTYEFPPASQDGGITYILMPNGTMKACKTDIYRFLCPGTGDETRLTIILMEP